MATMLTGCCQTIAEHNCYILLSIGNCRDDYCIERLTHSLTQNIQPSRVRYGLSNESILIHHEGTHAEGLGHVMGCLPPHVLGRFQSPTPSPLIRPRLCKGTTCRYDSTPLLGRLVAESMKPTNCTLIDFSF